MKKIKICFIIGISAILLNGCNKPDKPPQYYTVNFAGEGVDIEPQTIENRNYATEPDNPEREGYAFEGWFIDNATFVNKWDFKTYAVTQDTTLYAKWEIEKEPCNCIMDTLNGDWSWYKREGGHAGGTVSNNFKSIIRILSQNEDESINYDVLVADTLFYRGSFQIQEGLWNYKKTDIKLPHIIISPPGNKLDYWFFHFFDEKEIYFWDGMMDGYFYHYKKEEE